MRRSVSLMIVLLVGLSLGACATQPTPAPQVPLPVVNGPRLVAVMAQMAPAIAQTVLECTATGHDQNKCILDSVQASAAVAEAVAPCLQPPAPAAAHAAQGSR